MSDLQKTTIAIVFGFSALCGCSKLSELFNKNQEEQETPAPLESTSASASAVPSGSATAPPAGSGQTLIIPAGTLVAGTPCDQFPKITTEELAGTAIQLGDFKIDEYPFPNDPKQAPVTNVTRDEAAQMCAGAGKRLCTEFEWERACKGGGNQEYAYGRSYQPNACPTLTPGPQTIGTRPQCTSSYGVRDMHGLVWEWTDSPWGRGSSGGLITVRGGFGANGEIIARCANGDGRTPTEKRPDLGFRCCSGPKNPAEVNLAQSKLPALTEEPAVDSALAAKLIASLPKDAKPNANATVTFDKIWRWHPKPNEELVLGRFTIPSSGPGTKPERRAVVYKICGGNAINLGTSRGADIMTNPATGTDAQGVSIKVAAPGKDGEVHFHYNNGRVTVEQPPWMTAKGGDAGVPSRDGGGAPAASASAKPATAAKDAGAHRPTTVR